MTSGQKSLPAIGFLTITRDVEHGLFGGYLVLNAMGRPLEFHCTAPVRPSRAQEILYGPTLEAYLYGERIAPTLVEKTKSAPLAVFTDVEPAMAGRPLVAMPLVLVLGNRTEEDLGTAPRADVPPPAKSGPAGVRCDEPHGVPAPSAPRLLPFGLGTYHLACCGDYPQDAESIRSNCLPLAHQIDLDEPFGRIREAIEEARNGVR